MSPSSSESASSAQLESSSNLCSSWLAKVFELPGKLWLLVRISGSCCRTALFAELMGVVFKVGGSRESLTGCRKSTCIGRKIRCGRAHTERYWIWVAVGNSFGWTQISASGEDETKVEGAEVPCMKQRMTWTRELKSKKKKMGKNGKQKGKTVATIPNVSLHFSGEMATGESCCILLQSALKHASEYLCSASSPIPTNACTGISPVLLQSCCCLCSVRQPPEHQGLLFRLQPKEKRSAWFTRRPDNTLCFRDRQCRVGWLLYFIAPVPFSNTDMLQIVFLLLLRLGSKKVLFPFPQNHIFILSFKGFILN